jgi:hypothetical protein
MITAENVRAKLPVPVIKSHGLGLLLGTVAFVVAACWLYDAYDGQGRQGPWPVSTLFPW